MGTSIVLSRAIDLEWRVLNPNVRKIYKLCIREVETLEHFILKCVSLQESSMYNYHGQVLIIIKIL